MLILPDDGADAARTHALVIGVGGYRHLRGGVDEKQDNFEHVGLMRQLTSPPVSAVAFAREVLAIDQNDGWVAPLGSVELLVSPAPGAPDPIPAGWLGVEAATIDNIRQAYDAWRTRCDRDEGNVAVLYFSGHGLEKQEQYLLAEDFGATRNPWLGAFAFDSTRLAFHGCRAQTQLFFIDACRQVTSGMLRTEPTAIPLDVPDLLAPECAFSLALQASAHAEKAFGPVNGETFFTQALLRGLSGAAASNTGGGWTVQTGELAARITQILRLVQADEGFVQRCAARVTDSTEIVRLAGPPRVAVELACDPEAANAVADLVCQRLDVAGEPDLSRHGAPWSFDVEAGFYRAHASFADGSFDNAEAPIIAMPPEQRSVLRVKS